MDFSLTVRMVDCMFLLTRILLISCSILIVHCARPNCTSVADFDGCPGNITDFCPENIVCACKDGEPFCKCPNFRGQWGNYWYMGAKCDQLWNTLDLVLVAALPAIGLALIVGVTIQTIHYCKKKSIKNVDDYREQKSFSGLQPQHNSTCVFNTDMNPSQHDQGQKQKINYIQSPFRSSNENVLPRSLVSPPSQFSGRNYNFITHEPKEDNPYSYNWDASQGRAQPEANYGNKNFSTMHMKPIFSFPTSGIPKSSYIQRERQQIGYPIPEEPEIPYGIGRMQRRFNY